MYTEATTKDGNLGVIVVADTVAQILSECSAWVRDNRLKAKDIAAGKLVDVKTQASLGELIFSDDGVACVPSR